MRSIPVDRCAMAFDPWPRGLKRFAKRGARLAADKKALAAVLAELRARRDGNAGPLAKLGDDLKTLLRLLDATVSGRYPALPQGVMTAVGAALLYWLMPLDLIPDPILALGFIDDAAILGWVLKRLSDDLVAFRGWEKAQALEDKP
ncbi:MAG: YkvA family protein [Pseudomonadales bacterium]